MQINSMNELQRRERTRETSKKADRFWSSFLLTKDGKVKSALLLNSFCLCAVFVGVYFAAFYFLLDGLHLLTANAPPALANTVQSLAPAAVGTAVCCLAWFLPGEKRLMPAAYLWMAALAAACLVTMLILLGGDGLAQLLFLQMFALAVPAPLLLGGAASWLLYARRQRKKRPAAGTET